ncbi:hypothetical protein H4S01_000644 [Coemansia sp. RSA 2610]|nr:hypothetical protein H4S01_000644 [Coemansia sp. RSA 2610]
MARGGNHEYTELADMTVLPDGASEARVYQAQAGQTARRISRLSVLLQDADMRRHFMLSGTYILLWYTFSGVLSVYNKWLFGSSERDFPFPLFVTSIHMLVQYMLASVCLRVFPQLQPAKTPSWSVYLTRAVPCGVASALDVGLSNISLRTITLTFYTMCKSSTLGFVLFFAFLFGLERVRLSLIAIIVIISAGVVLMAAGEVDFVLAGFLEAIGSSAMSGLRWSLTQILLSQARFGMNNPVATMSRLTPIIGSSMLLFSLVLEHPFTEISKNKNTDTPHGVLLMALMMIVGGLLAFAMVLSEFFLIARTSVVTLSIAGMLKEVVMVGVAHLIFGDSMTLVNGCGLLVALFGIGLYNWLKIHDTLNEAGTKEQRTAGEVEAQTDSARQRQLVFAAEPYDEVADIAAQSLSDWAADDGRAPGKGAISSSVNDSAIARRRMSVFTGSNSPPGGDMSASSSSSSEPSPEVPLQVGARKQSQASTINLDSIISQEHELDPGPAQLKHRE